MERGQLHAHIVLNPTEKNLAVEALQANGYRECADALEDNGYREIPPFPMSLIVVSLKKRAGQGDSAAQTFLDSYQRLPSSIDT